MNTRNAGGLALAAAAAAVLLLVSRKSEAATVWGENPQPSSDALPALNDFVYEDNPVPTQYVLPLDSSLPAFLYMIRRAEHFPADVANSADYGVFFGGSRFVDFSNHPILTGEKKGIPLSDATCRNAGLSRGCVSTAAGAYQFTLPTWREFGGDLPDFSPESQDEAARRLLVRIGAFADLQAGDVRGAILKAGERWASLPGSRARQNPKSMETALNYFNAGLERFA